MPNHCSNDLFITGPQEEIIRFREFAKNGDQLLDVEKFIPYPKEFRDKDIEAEKQREAISKMPEEQRRKAEYPKDGYNSGGYEWCIKHWGTKWGMYNIEVLNEGERKVSYEFNTAWSPAVPVIVKMSELFPKLKFVNKFYECGIGYQGKVVAKGGIILEQIEKPYNGPRGG